jgi:hypothetical protein
VRPDHRSVLTGNLEPACNDAAISTEYPAHDTTDAIGGRPSFSETDDETRTRERNR